MDDTNVAKAFDVLTDSRAAVELRELHRDFYLEFAERAEPELKGPDQASWLDLVEVEHGNLRAALEWSIARGDGDAALRMVAALGRFWQVRGYGSQARRWIPEALDAGADSPPLLRARALVVEAGERDRASREAAVEAARQVGDLALIAEALASLTQAVRWVEGPAAARPIAEEALDLARRSGRRDIEAMCLARLAGVVERRGEEHSTLREDAMTLFRGLGDHWSVAWQLHGLATWGSAGVGVESRTMTEECIAIATALKDDVLRAYALQARASTELIRGDMASAGRLYEEAAALMRARGDGARHLAGILVQLGWVALYRGDSADMRRRFNELSEVADDGYACEVLDGLALAAFIDGDHDAALSLEDEALAAARRTGQRPDIAHKLYERALLSWWAGDLDAADRYANEWVSFETPAGKAVSEWQCSVLAEIALLRGDHAVARSLLEQSVALAGRHVRGVFTPDVARPLVRLGDLARREGDLAAAVTHYREALKTANGLDLLTTAEVLEAFAKVAAARQDTTRAAVLLGAAAALRDRIELAVRPGPDSADYKQHVELVRERLGEDTFSASWSEGHAMDVDGAIALAME